MTGFDVLTVGETMVLLAPAVPEPLETAVSLDVHVGGAESNLASWLAADGIPVAWASRVGDDPFGRRMRSEIASYGVDVSLVTVDGDAPTGVYFKDPDAASTRVHYYRRGSAASRMDEHLVPGLPVAEVRLLHLTGITPGLSPTCGQLVDALIGKARRSGTTVSFDVNYRPGVWAVDVAADRLRALADAADIVFVGLDEAATVWGCETAGDVRALLPGPAHVVVKDGAVGATEFGPEGAIFVPAHAVEVVEAVGAGDAFAAGYLAAMLRGSTPAEALQHGHDTAARALTGTGDVSIERRAE